MDVFHFFKEQILDVLKGLTQQGKIVEGLDLSRVTAEPPKDSSHGDIATNAAMVLAKPSGQSPRILADLIASELRKNSKVIKVDIAGPGFINLTLQPEFWQSQLFNILKAGIAYGDLSVGKSELINVEYVSTNPTGPMHAGHGRNAVLGDVIAALLKKTGYTVVREYYVNDAGGQTNALARSVYLRYLEALGNPLSADAFEQDMYGGDYLIPVGQELATREGTRWVNQPEIEWMDDIRQFSIDAMMKRIRQDLSLLGIEMDVYTSERALVERKGIEKVLSILQEKGDLYTGVLEKPKGHDDEDWEPRPQTLFRATAYGDDVDRPLQKSDGSWTYFAGDIAYHYNKFDRGFRQMIDVLGADHGGYFKRIQAAVTAVTQGEATVEIKVCQMVNFMENGIPVRMSKRAGTFISLKDVVDRVGKDAVRFMMLTRRQDVPIDFDFVKVLEQARDNPLFYIQYAHARICSVLRHAQSVFPEPEDWSQINIKLLFDPTELEMIRLLAGWPRQVTVAALTGEPHRIASYLYDVAGLFHTLWNKGKENTQLRFIDPENGSLTLARMGLIKAVATVISSGLYLFGITPVEEMR